MKAVVISFFLLALYGAVRESEASEAWNGLLNPRVYFTFPVFKYSDQCAYNGRDVTLDYRRAIYDFATNFFKPVAASSHLHTVNSPFSIWLMLAAMAEGTEGPAQQELFKVLNLPDDKCQRQEFYELASKTEVNSPDATLLRTQIFAYDETLKLNEIWKNYIYTNCLMNTLPVPMKRDPLAAEAVMRNLISTRIPITDFKGNSALLDSLDYQALWTTAFSDIVEKAPFYNDIGQQIGTIDLMKTKKRVRMMYLPYLKMKVLELPVGYNGRYRMMLGLAMGSTKESLEAMKNTIVFEVLDGLQTSRIPIDIAIPRFTMTSEYDARPFLEGLGVRSMWTDSNATRNISDPAANPSSMVQRVTITFDRAGVHPNTEELPSFLSGTNSCDSETGLDPILGREFIANKPFFFALLDTDTYMVMITSVFSRPTTNFVFKK
ncbi:serine protease inhibitor 77Ba [Manduca sexta]|uniref:Serpin domain-containing protein n=1 Tax=Manduca sexta TaxID=7130 RepID=A0A922CFG9_MANSE|nr:serine protease inhibitor 77Ba [Manduca sexta]KAG6443418.1 hypothetical protein O3G_MSEX002832 [Manduca sexta]KAG6443419.1 hypothetical protein O3G_MSEX002832 [Manduca sexta]